MQAIPTIGSVMTPSPLTVEIDEPVRVAQDRMTDHEIRHLPVVEGGSLVGVVSDRDLSALENDAESKSLAERVLVRDVCSLDFYAVAPNELLDIVLTEMAERRIGSAIVVENGAVTGLFTATDACRRFAEHLRSNST